MATTVTDPGLPVAAPTAQPTRLRRLSSPFTVAVGAIAGSAALHFRDPHVQGSWGMCPTALLGFDCPACGSLRAVYHLTNADLVAAASSNLLLVMFLPIGLVLWCRRLRGAWLGGPAYHSLRVPRWVWVLVWVMVVTFTVARNLPYGGWLHS